MNIDDSMNLEMSKIDQEIMRHLLSYNQKVNKYSPFGACLVDRESRIMSYGFGYNPNNPAHHAETDAINQCALKHSNVNWHELTMYSTGEPCIMCSAACCWVNVRRIVYGTDVPFIAKLWNEEANMRCQDIINASPNKPQLTGYVCQVESDQMFLSYKELYLSQPKDGNAILS